MLMRLPNLGLCSRTFRAIFFLCVDRGRVRFGGEIMARSRLPCWLLVMLLLWWEVKRIAGTNMTLVDDDYSDGFIHVLSANEYDDNLDEIISDWGKEKPMAPINQRDDSVRANITLAGYGPFGIGPAIRDWMSAYALYRKPLANVYHEKDFFNDTQSIYFLRDGLSAASGSGLRGMFRDGVPPIMLNDTQQFTYISRKPNETLSFVISPMISGDVDNGLFPDLVPFIPIVASMLVITHNIQEIPSSTDLKLSWLQLVQIFNGSVKSWKDPALNLGSNNEWYTSSFFGDPDENYTINICLDTRPSYDNFALSMLLLSFGYGYGWTQNMVLADWTGTINSTASPLDGSPRPLPPYVANFRQGTSLVQYLGHSQSLDYSISMSTFKEAQDNNAAMASLETGPGTGVYVYPDRDALTSVVTAFGEINGTIFPPKVYPLVLLYSMVFKLRGLYLGKPMECNRTTAMMRFWRFLATNKDLRAMPSSEPYVFMDAKMYYINRQRLKNVTCYDSENPTIAYNAWELMKMEIRNESAISIADADMSATIIFAAVLTPTIAICLYGTYELIILFFILKRIRDAVYKISSSEIFLVQKLNAPTDRFKGVIASRRVVDYHTPKSYVHTMYFGRYKAYQVMLRPCSLNIHRMNQKIKRALVEMIDHSQHPHVSTFYGISEVKNGRYFVSNFCPYGDLRSLMIAKEQTFTLNMKFSLSCDIAEGMEFLHRNGILHGNLRSCAIYIEANLAAKVGDWEYNHLHRLQGSYFAQETRLAKRLTLFEQTAFYPWLYWTAPEVLQSGMLGAAALPTKAQDVYSFGIILGEIFGEDAAFQRYQDSPYNFTPTDILTKVLSGNLRPRLLPGNDAPMSIHHLIEHCWTFNPKQRPTFKQVRKILHKVTSFRKPISDLLVIESQLMADKLKRRGQRMEERFETVSKEFHRYSRVLVPYPIWRRIYLARTRPPLTRHEDAVVLRCSLTNFDGLLTAHDPQVAMDTLNLMHRVFDEIVERNGRVYRLHWDGPTVVAVGGVPFGLELDPVHSIAQIAFEYMIWAYNSRTPFNQPLKLRFGIHSGAVSAGCLDYSAPHYVLFGDLMKTAYLIETASKPYRILVSEDFNDQLKKLAKVYVRYRVIEATHPVRGYDKRTFWLIGSNYFEQQYLLDDILYGKDELDTQGNDFVPYNTEEGIVNDNHASQVEPLDGKDIHGSFNPSVLESAAVIRALKKRKVGIMKVPPAHVLNAQILRVSKDGKRYFQGQDGDQESYLHHHHGDQDENFEDLPPTPADVLVGIYQRTEVKEAPEAADETGPLLQKLHLEDNPLMISEKAKRRQFESRIQALRSEPSFLSSIRSEQVSAGSGETSHPIRARLDMLHSPAFGGILTTGADSSKSVAKLEETPTRPYVVASRTDHRRLQPASDEPEITFSGMDSEYILDTSSVSLPKEPENPDPVPEETDPVVEQQPPPSILPDVVESVVPSEWSVSHSSFNTQASRSSYASTMTVLSSVVPRHGISSREIEEQLTELAIPIMPRSVRPEEEGQLLPNQRKFDEVTEMLSVPLATHRPQVTIGTVEKVSDDTIHVFADPPSMDSNLSDLAITPSMMEHINRLKEADTTDFHPIEATSEEFNNRRDRTFQSVRDAEFHHTDSDSFKLAHHRFNEDRKEPPETQPPPGAELISNQQQEPTTLVIRNPLFEETSLRQSDQEPEQPDDSDLSNVTQSGIRPRFDQINLTNEARLNPEVGPASTDHPTHVHHMVELAPVTAPTTEWSMESVALEEEPHSAAPDGSTQQTVDDGLSDAVSARGVNDGASPGSTVPPSRAGSPAVSLPDSVPATSRRIIREIFPDTDEEDLQ